MPVGQSAEQTFRWFIATVEDVASDPKQLGRVKIRVLNQHDFDEVETEELLYAQISMPAMDASYYGVGRSPTGIEIGTRCWGFFQDGSRKNNPVICGTFHHIPEGKEENHWVHGLARENQTIDTKNERESGELVEEPESAYAAKYPHNKTFTTPEGHAVEIDDTKGEERIHVYHKSGTYIEINKEGRTVIKCVGDSYEIDVKDKYMLVKGNVTVEIDGEVTAKVKNNINIETQNNFSLTVSNNFTVSVGNTITMTACSVNITPNDT